MPLDQLHRIVIAAVKFMRLRRRAIVPGSEPARNTEGNGRSGDIPALSLVGNTAVECLFFEGGGGGHILTRDNASLGQASGVWLYVYPLTT